MSPSKFDIHAALAQASASWPVMLQLHADAKDALPRLAASWFWTSMAAMPQHRQQTATPQHATTTTQTVGRPAMAWVHIRSRRELAA